MSRRRAFIISAALLVAVTACMLRATGWDVFVHGAIFGKSTVADRIAQFAPSVRQRLTPNFARARVSYPPSRVIFVGMKAEKRLDLYAADSDSDFKFIRSYPILAASGVPGPKLLRGDRQVPEGIYTVESLNPNSRFHLALRVGYPNDFDRAMARADGRTDLGSDIMIHGSNASVGCLAMGDQAAEDLFILAAETGIEKVTVILVPHNLRGAAPDHHALPAWTAHLYEELSTELSKLPERIDVQSIR